MSIYGSTHCHWTNFKGVWVNIGPPKWWVARIDGGGTTYRRGTVAGFLFLTHRGSPTFQVHPTVRYLRIAMDWNVSRQSASETLPVSHSCSSLALFPSAFCQRKRKKRRERERKRCGLVGLSLRDWCFIPSVSLRFLNRNGAVRGAKGYRVW